VRFFFLKQEGNRGNYVQIPIFVQILVMEKIKLKNNYKKFGLILLLSIILVCLLDALVPFRYEDGDDVLMSLISSGVYHGHPDSHLVFVHIGIGSFLKLLHQSFPSVEWYSVLLYSLQLIAFSWLITLIISRENSLKHKLFSVLLIIPFFLVFFIWLQFSQVAGVLAITAVVSLLYFKKIRWDALLLLILSTMLRYEVSLFILLLSTPFVVLGDKALFDIRKKGILEMFVLIMITAMVIFVDKQSHASQEWSDFYTYNKLRGSLHDNYNIYQVHNKNEPEMILFRSFLIDEKIITLEYLQEFEEEIENLSFFKKISSIKQLLTNKSVAIFMVIFLVLIVLYLIVNPKRNKKILVFLSMVVGMFIILGLFKTIKFRVFALPILMLVVFIGFLNDHQKHLKKGYLIKGVFILMMGIFSYKFAKAIKWTADNFLIRNRNLAFQKEYLEKNPSKKLILFGNHSQSAFTHPLFLSRDYPKNKIIFSGWMAQNPLNNEKFDSFDYFIEGNGLFILKDVASGVAKNIEKHIEKHYQTKVQHYYALENEHYCILAFKKVE
jgi:hypothetical protein